MTTQAVTIDHWISCTLVPGASGRTAPVHDPATGRVTGEVPLASTAEVDAAVKTAAAAARDWRTSSLSKRAAVLFAFRALLHTRTAELATCVPQLLKGGFSEQAASGVDVYSIRQPLGVVAGITPFNFPVMVPLWMCANAIACGNAFVLKPSEKDPSASLFLAELLKEAGLPDGVFSVVQGDKEAVDALLEHPDVQAVSFVGSTAIAQKIYETG